MRRSCHSACASLPPNEEQCRIQPSMKRNFEGRVQTGSLFDARHRSPSRPIAPGEIEMVAKRVRSELIATAPKVASLLSTAPVVRPRAGPKAYAPPAVWTPAYVAAPTALGASWRLGP